MPRKSDKKADDKPKVRPVAFRDRSHIRRPITAGGEQLMVERGRVIARTEKGIAALDKRGDFQRDQHRLEDLPLAKSEQEE